MLFSFLPWLACTRELSIGPVRLVPYSTIGRPVDGVEFPAYEDLNSIMASYVDIFSEGITRCSLFTVEGRDPPWSIEDSDVEDILSASMGIFLSGLASFSFDHLGHCPNSTSFRPVFHRFSPPASFCSIESRTLGGVAGDMGYRFGEFKITEPLQCRGRNYTFEDGILKALSEYLSKDKDNCESLLAGPVSLFAMARTDDELLHTRPELALTVASIEHLLDPLDRGNSGFADAVTAVLGTGSDLVEDLLASRPTAKLKDTRSSPSWAWARDLYLARNAVLHSRPREEAAWTDAEHIVLATLAFPLLTKGLLSRLGYYKATAEDCGRLYGFSRALTIASDEFRVDDLRRCLLGGGIDFASVKAADILSGGDGEVDCFGG